MSDQILDLFGDPVPANRGRPGRPSHVPTEQNRRTVSMLTALGWNNERIAQTLRITPPSLRKHYFFELRARDVARDRLNARMAILLWDQGERGNTGAIREFRKFLERNDLMTFGQTSQPHGRRDEKPAKLGKKEQQLVDAQQPDQGTVLGELMARRQGGSLDS